MQTWLKLRIRSFKYAFFGIANFVRQNANFKIMLVAALLCIGSGLYFQITRTEWILIGICIANVLTLEMINSAIENICDAITKEKNNAIKFIKDVTAGAVLVMSITSFIIGLLVFVPYILKWP